MTGVQTCALPILRCFENDDVIHVSGSVGPARDAEVINLELGLADLAQVEKRRERLVKQLRTSKEAQLEDAALARIQAVLEEQKMTTRFRDMLETFDNQFPGRDYTIEIVCPEFTSVCPKTGQPDFGTLTFTYTPAAKCVELKSLKMYLQQFRNEGIFYENITNRILEDLVSVVQPRRMKLVASFTPRGGISTSVTVCHEAEKAS